MSYTISNMVKNKLFSDSPTLIFLSVRINRHIPTPVCLFALQHHLPSALQAALREFLWLLNADASPLHRLDCE
jgi:hypothetical protein